MKTRLILYIIILCLPIKVWAQSATEIEQIAATFKYTPEKPDYKFARQNNSNELKLILTGAFFVYKYCVSPFDSNSCTFHPSCSVYALQSIKKRGIFVGSLATFDRLLRCNGLSPENYKKHKHTHLLEDEVE